MSSIGEATRSSKTLPNQLLWPITTIAHKRQPRSQGQNCVTCSRRKRSLANKIFWVVSCIRPWRRQMRYRIRASSSFGCPWSSAGNGRARQRRACRARSLHRSTASRSDRRSRTTERTADRVGVGASSARPSGIVQCRRRTVRTRRFWRRLRSAVTPCSRWHGTDEWSVARTSPCNPAPDGTSRETPTAVGPTDAGRTGTWSRCRVAVDWAPSAVSSSAGVRAKLATPHAGAGTRLHDYTKPAAVIAVNISCVFDA